MSEKKNGIAAEAEKLLSAAHIGEKDKILAALSGGADSLCLLLVLNDYCREHNIKLSAVHINHCLRGAESDRDEAFCRAVCQRLGIPLYVHKENAAEYAARLGMSCEEGARHLRYKIFAERAEGGFIATAHNLGDNAETVLINLARGTGLKGLCGIPPIRDNILRPLINVCRSDIEEYLRSRGETWVTDSTNSGDDFTRNKIRHSVLPVLREINSGVLENIGKMTAVLRSEDEFLDRLAVGLPEDIASLRQADPVLRRRYVIRRIKAAGLTADVSMTERAEQVILRGGRQQLSGKIFAAAEKGGLFIGEIPENGVYSGFEVPFTIGETPLPDGRRLYAEKIYFNKTKDSNSLLTNFDIDCDKIQGGTVLRVRRQGDEIRLKGEGFHRKLRKVYNAAKIPPRLRESAVVLEKDGVVIFAEYCGVSAEAAAHENTAAVIRISVK